MPNVLHARKFDGLLWVPAGEAAALEQENERLAARLAEAERRITEALAYDDNMDKTTRSILDGSEQFEQRPAASASGMEDVGQ